MRILQILRNLFKDVAKGLATFERKVLRRMFGGIKVNENWGKRCSKEQNSCVEIGIVSYLRKSWLNCFDHVNSLESKRKVIEELNNTPIGIQ